MPAVHIDISPYTIGWICSNHLQTCFAQYLLDKWHGTMKGIARDPNTYILGSIGGHDIAIVSSSADRHTTEPVLISKAGWLRETFKGIRFVLKVGNGGGVPSAAVDIRLGDVIVGVSQCDYSSLIAYGERSIEYNSDSLFSTLLGPPPQILLTAIEKVQAGKYPPNGQLSNHMERIGTKTPPEHAGPDVLFKSYYTHEGGDTCVRCSATEQKARHLRDTQAPMIHYGRVATGDKEMESAIDRDRISAELGGVLCFEVGAAGPAALFPCLVICGVSHYADSHKYEGWQAYAATTSAACAKEILLAIPSEYSNCEELHGWQIGAEKFLSAAGPAPKSKLTKKRSIGFGRTGKVEEVSAEWGSVTMARKEVFVHHIQRSDSQERIRRVEKEIEVLKRLSHLHIVEIIGCYREKDGKEHLNLYTLMQPAGDGDLTKFLAADSTSFDFWLRSKWIKQWFVCLTSALAYMHSENVLHEDIKPSNIIHRRDRIYFTDFDSSRKLEHGDKTSTTSEARATRMFAAPEAFLGDRGEIMSHGSKTDVFSLGLVFVELIIVLIGKRIEDFRNYVFSDVKPHSRQYHRTTQRFRAFIFKDVETMSDETTIRAFNQCFEHMLRKNRKDRPSAKAVLAKMRKRKAFESLLSCDCTQGIENMEDSGADSDWEYLEGAQD